MQVPCYCVCKQLASLPLFLNRRVQVTVFSSSCPPGSVRRIVFKAAATDRPLKQIIELAGAGHNALGAVVTADDANRAVYVAFLGRCLARMQR